MCGSARDEGSRSAESSAVDTDWQITVVGVTEIRMVTRCTRHILRARQNGIPKEQTSSRDRFRRAGIVSWRGDVSGQGTHDTLRTAEQSNRKEHPRRCDRRDDGELQANQVSSRQADCIAVLAEAVYNSSMSYWERTESVGVAVQAICCYVLARTSTAS